MIILYLEGFTNAVPLRGIYVSQTLFELVLDFEFYIILKKEGDRLVGARHQYDNFIS